MWAFADQRYTNVRCPLPSLVGVFCWGLFECTKYRRLRGLCWEREGVTMFAWQRHLTGPLDPVHSCEQCVHMFSTTRMIPCLHPSSQEKPGRACRYLCFVFTTALACTRCTTQRKAGGLAAVAHVARDAAIH